MLLDVLDELEEIKICTAYDIGGGRVSSFPSHVDDLRQAVPVLETLPGWRQDTTGVRRMEDLPGAARGYLNRLSQLIGRPVEFVSVGPDRAQTIFAQPRAAEKLKK
jgi:adenylosuccinate synthase